MVTMSAEEMLDLIKQMYKIARAAADAHPDDETMETVAGALEMVLDYIEE